VQSEFSGVESDMTICRTKNANKTVILRDVFSPDSGGNQYTYTCPTFTISGVTKQGARYF